MNILDYIPFGEENAVTRMYLKKHTGLSDRFVREYISQARRKQPVLSFGKGYFRPREEERHLADKWLRQETKRAKSIFWSSKGAKNFIKAVG